MERDTSHPHNEKIIVWSTLTILVLFVFGWLIYGYFESSLIHLIYENRYTPPLDSLLPSTWKTSRDLFFDRIRLTLSYMQLIGLIIPIGLFIVLFWKRLSQTTKFLLSLLTIHLICINFGLLVLLSSTTTYQTFLGETMRFMRVEEGNDSWNGLFLAHERAQSDSNNEIYTPVLNGKSKFQYPPSSLFLVEGFCMLAPKDSYYDANKELYSLSTAVSKLISWLSIIMLIWCLMRIYDLSLSWTTGPPGRLPAPDALARYALIFCLAITFYPLMRSYALGQVQTWISALLTLAILLWMKGKQKSAGLLIGLTCLLKPHYSFLLLWAAWRRQHRFALTGMIVIGVGLVASLFTYGIENHIDYLKVLNLMSRTGESFWPNQSINGIFHRLFHNGEIINFRETYAPFHIFVYLGTLVSSLIIILFALRKFDARTNVARTSDFCIALLSCTMASPIAWEHHYGILLPIFAFMIPAAFRYPLFKKATIICVAVSYLLTSNYFYFTIQFADSPYGLNLILSYLFFGALLLLVCLYKLRRISIRGKLQDE